MNDDVIKSLWDQGKQQEPQMDARVSGTVLAGKPRSFRTASISASGVNAEGC